MEKRRGSNTFGYKFYVSLDSIILDELPADDVLVGEMFNPALHVFNFIRLKISEFVKRLIDWGKHFDVKRLLCHSPGSIPSSEVAIHSVRSIKVSSSSNIEYNAIDRQQNSSIVFTAERFQGFRSINFEKDCGLVRLRQP